MTQMYDREITTVRAAEDMPREDFFRHMNLRHTAPLGDVDISQADEYVERCWRAYHKQLHALRLQADLDHDHGQPRGQQQ